MTECEAMQALLEYAQKEQYDFIVKNSAHDEEYQLIMKRADSTPKILNQWNQSGHITLFQYEDPEIPPPEKIQRLSHVETVYADQKDGDLS